MKKLLLLAFLCFSTFAMSAQEISEEQWSLISKRTADWCTNCGTWGWTFKNDLLADHQDKNVVFWMLHYSGGLKTETAKAISDNFGGGGQPVFYLEGANINVGAGNTADKRAEVAFTIDNYILFPPFAGVGTTALFDGEKITTTSRAKLLIEFEDGDFWLASYLVDDELVAPQASQGNNAVHENILLHSLHGTDYFGENVSTTGGLNDQEFIVEGELDFSGQTNIPDYTDGYSIVTVLWSIVDGKYTPVNLNRQPITSVVSTNDILDNVDVAAFHLGAGQVNLNITADQKINNANILLLDINGQTVASQKGIQINDGENQILLEAQELTIGTYVVVIESDLGSKSIKVSVR